MKTFKPNVVLILENALPWFSLVFSLFFTLSFFFFLPYSGMDIGLNNQGWEVTGVTSSSSLRLGDILTRVGAVSSLQAQKDLSTGFFNPLSNGQTVEIELMRNGQPMTLSYKLPGWTSEELLGRLNNNWFLGYIFWLAGLGALLFLRPRGLLRRVFMLFCFLTAAWLSAGTISGLRFMGSARALRALVGLSVPVYLHLHWLFPTPLGKLPGWVWGALYGLCALLAHCWQS